MNSFLTCDLCQSPAEDSMEFESGNNAEIAVQVTLCKDHLDEQEQAGPVFETKYADQILKLAEETLHE